MICIDLSCVSLRRWQIPAIKAIVEDCTKKISDLTPVVEVP